jgi:FkbM family methyltransferase
MALFGARNQNETSWSNLASPVRVFYDHHISAYVAVNLKEWGGRWYYFAGRYYDQANQLLISKLLGKGDTYIDIGANLGIHTLAASKIVGDNGLVIAIEPNPDAYSHLLAHLVMNRITNVRPFNVGLSDTAGDLDLRGLSEHTGTFTFREVSQSTRSVKVPVVLGDQIIDKNILRGRVLVKVDTEGFEHRVIRGLNGLMSYRDVGFVIEVTDQWLRETGSSAQDLYAELRRHGFQSYRVKLAYSWFRPVLKLEHVDLPPSEQHDALFLRTGVLR